LSGEKPNITCFMCNWTGYEEELSTIRTQEAFPSVNVVCVPCIGRLDPVTIFDTYLEGKDGILIVGCAVPDCHFIKGNVYARSAVNVTKKLLAASGLGSERLEMRLVSPVEGIKLSDLIVSFEGKLMEIGRSPLGGKERDPDLYEKTLATRNAAAGFRLRALISKQEELTGNVNRYDEKIPEEEFDSFSDDVVRAEFERQRILLSIRNKPTSVKELALNLGVDTSLVLRHILNLRRQGIVTMDHVDRTTPLYKAMENGQ
jgi:F420-non-reducing hydrogenase iron-sulfur subunit